MELKLGDLQIKQGYSIGEVKMAVAQVGGGGTSNYEDLENLPQINGVELKGNKTPEQLGIVGNETDPTVPSHVKAITEQNIVDWNNKAEQTDIPDVSEFITNAVDNLLNYYLKSEVYTKEEVRDLISKINKFKTQVVSELPSESIDPLTMYFIARVDASGNDYYEEYLYIGNKFELIGTTKLDLAGYVTTEALNTALSNYVQTSALTNYYTISEIDALIGNVNTALESILGV